MTDTPKTISTGKSSGSRTAQEPDELEQRWLIGEVVPVYDAMRDDPGRALSTENVFNSIRQMHAERLKDRA